jgi:hypothetical protein
MKFSCEFSSEDEARSHESALQASGYRAWCSRKADGMWEVFWCYGADVESMQASVPTV